MKTLITVMLGICSLAALGQTKSKATTAANDTTSTPSTAFRMHFDDLFRHNADNSISPMLPLEIHGEMVNTATKIANGVKYGGIEIMRYTGHDALVDTMRGVVIVHKFLK
ncbi:MAG TPA: hypothetical protein VHE59_20600 [Mucilaginibacter sp.]|nr:hypothetical protein [Mucilaginibacter sp.]